MKKINLILLMIFNFAIIIKAQTAEEVIAKHLEITGGLTKWRGFNSVVLKGEMVLGVNESYNVEIYQQRPNWNKTYMYVQGKKITLNAYNGKKAIQYDFQSNKLVNKPDYVPESFDSDLINFSDKGFQAVFIGTEKIEQSNCYKIKLIKNTNITTYYFDMKSYQLIREESVSESKTFSDFRKASGLYFPYRIEVKSTNGESDFVLIIKTINVNQAIPGKEFTF
ncbi:histidine kinase [Apibacter raozihei]|uniref:histidine kinase n=1 Tax=Apibacter raozihei TaxID=2500547 RepID=UPI000FE30814|nr:histidine kinase [Apibacter raozihei]